MGEAKRKKDLGLSPKKTKYRDANNSERIISWLPITNNQKDSFIKLSIKASWVGIGILVFLWILVRFIGPSLGWWTPADSF